MMSKDYTQIIGVDVAKQKLDLHASKTKNDSTIAYEVEEVTAYLKQHCKAKGSTLVVMEATGGYESLLVDTLHAKGIDCAVVNPFKVRSFARALGLIENGKNWGHPC